MYHNKLINYGLMANLMRGKTDQYFKTKGSCPPDFVYVIIANGAFWINLDHQLRAEILPIFSNIVNSSAATYFILVIRECDGLFLYRRRHKEGVPLKKGGGSAPKKGVRTPWTPPTP